VISVVVPLGGDCPHRARAWQWVRAQYDGHEVVEGYGNPDGWCKAQAVADGLSRASGDLLVIADADVWSERLQAAIEAVESGEFKYAAPHRRVRRLTEQGTERFMNGERETAPTTEQHQSVLGGGIVVLYRETYEQAPLDPRFVGWGGEDSAWGAALRTLAGKPFIGRYPLWHLWHPPQQRMTRRVGNVANDELRIKYLQAQGSVGRMSALIEEGRCLSTGSSRRQ
jgi:hypothetical protein